MTPDPKGDRIDQIAQLLKAGLIAPSDMEDFMDGGGMSFSIPPSLLRQRLEQKMDYEKKKMVEKIEQNLFGQEGAEVARERLDLAFKGKPPVHQPLWDKIAKICEELIEKAMAGGAELVEPDPSLGYMQGQGTVTRPIVYLGSYVERIFKEDMQRAYGGQAGEIRLGGCRVTSDSFIEPEQVVVMCHGHATVPCLVTNGKKNDWAWTSFTYDQHALTAGDEDDASS